MSGTMAGVDEAPDPRGLYARRCLDVRLDPARSHANPGAEVEPKRKRRAERKPHTTRGVGLL